MSIQMLYLFGLSFLRLVGHGVLGNGSRSSIPPELHSAVGDVADSEVASSRQRHWRRRRGSSHSEQLASCGCDLTGLPVAPALSGQLRAISSCNEQISQKVGDLQVVP